MDSYSDIWNKHRRWCRLIIFLYQYGESACKDILSKMGIKDVKNGAEIYSKLEPYEREIEKMGFYHKKNLLPVDKVIDTSKMDIILSTHIIEILDKQEDYPLIFKLRRKWIELLFMSNSERDLTEQQFKDYWNKISLLLSDLHCDMKLVKDLKTEQNLSKEHEKILEEITNKIKGTIVLVLSSFCAFCHCLKYARIVCLK